MEVDRVDARIAFGALAASGAVASYLVYNVIQQLPAASASRLIATIMLGIFVGEVFGALNYMRTYWGREFKAELGLRLTRKKAVTSLTRNQRWPFASITTAAFRETVWPRLLPDALNIAADYMA